MEDHRNEQKRVLWGRVSRFVGGSCVVCRAEDENLSKSREEFNYKTILYTVMSLKLHNDISSLCFCTISSCSLICLTTVVTSSHLMVQDAADQLLVTL